MRWWYILVIVALSTILCGCIQPQPQTTSNEKEEIKQEICWERWSCGIIIKKDGKWCIKDKFVGDIICDISWHGNESNISVFYHAIKYSDGRIDTPLIAKIADPKQYGITKDLKIFVGGDGSTLSDEDCVIFHLNNSYHLDVLVFPSALDEAIEDYQVMAVCVDGVVHFHTLFSEDLSPGKHSICITTKDYPVAGIVPPDLNCTMWLILNKTTAIPIHIKLVPVKTEIVVCGKDGKKVASIHITGDAKLVVDIVNHIIANLTASNYTVASWT